MGKTKPDERAHRHRSPRWSLQYPRPPKVSSISSAASIPGWIVGP
ncbi:hypothetical protein I551_4927 [Mycobacterium ulcerans str. Harvey]|uniref:Uncharacterized protein n=1 Tax=Mycobacterium ulcerans str. Harvey TaxID=1299332 RepID=A0ABN0QVE7_MYCUL|nr:hypothetical protein I551_4927 [Mycobacterium ulcerans str. Harvey]